MRAFIKNEFFIRGSVTYPLRGRVHNVRPRKGLCLLLFLVVRSFASLTNLWEARAVPGSYSGRFQKSPIPDTTRGVLPYPLDQRIAVLGRRNPGSGIRDSGR